MKHREFFIYQDFEFGQRHVCDFMQRGFVAGRTFDPIHVIEYAAYEELEAENARLMLTLKKAYKKHVQDDPRIGWNELGDILMSTLCDSIGDDEFVKFCEQEQKETK